MASDTAAARSREIRRDREFIRVTHLIQTSVEK